MHHDVDMPTPTPDEIRIARLAAGLTQAQACALADIAYQSKWAAYEAGTAPMNGMRWLVFLLRTDQHPQLKLVRRSR